jgi:PfaB family protein
LFPEIHQDVADLADDISASLKDRLLNPRTIIRPDFKALKQLDLNLRGNLADIAEAGVGFDCVFTKVFENVFKVKADYATGYSMGEVSMYAALGAWQQPGLMSARLANSDTFNHRLCGELLTLREHWGLSDNTNDQLIWETYTIKATLDEVIQASEGEDRVYCTIINTPDSLLLAGYPADCLRVIKKLGVRAMPLNMANAIHSAPANKEYDDMVELYTMDVMPRLATKMYSSSCYLPVPQLSKAIAHSVAKCLCDRVDFPRLINTLHNKGARVFIEMGPGRSLCSWVDKILDFTAESPVDSAVDTDSANKARVAVPVNAKGTSDELTYLRAIAKLTSHGVKLDLQTLFNGSIIVKNTKRTNLYN